MTTCATICTRALRRVGIVDAYSDPSSEDETEALALLNEMIDAWANKGVDVLKQADFVRGDELVFWVPPLEFDAAAIEAVSYRGTWNASTNSPALTTSVGTAGHVYRVSTSGSTTLDDVTSWSANDYAAFDGEKWRKGFSNARFQSGIIAMLGVRIAGAFSLQPSTVIVAEARDTWSAMVPYYAKPPIAGIDLAVRSVPSRNTAITYEEW